MKKIDSYLLLRNKDSVESFRPNNSITEPPDMEELDKYVKAPSLKDYDIQSIIKNLNALPCCFNDYLEKIIKEPHGPFQILEIRKRNIKIKMHFSESFENNNILCKWCYRKCPKSGTFKEKEITFAEANSRICSCAKENHDFSRQKTNLASISNEEKEINELIDLIKGCKNEEEEKKLIRKKSLNLIKVEENDKKLQIFSSILNVDETQNFFYSLNYDDDLHSEILTSLQKSINYSNYNNIMVNYIEKYFFEKLKFENPIYILNLNYSYKNNAYALYYYNPNFYSYSFYFQLYRKKIITKNIESNECISFLRKLGINNEILCSHMMNDKKLILWHTRRSIARLGRSIPLIRDLLISQNGGHYPN